MNIMENVPAPFRNIEHVWIEMPDGTRLAARLWLPDIAERTPVPAIFEYIPYRKGDMVRARDEQNHPIFASAGYACLRVDMRGSGDSEGHMPDMYDPMELSDARHVIDWIASRTWCSGSVGMFGTSWGGTASLQAALGSPKALKAVIAVCATHNRFEDDIHHMGGVLLTDSIEWGATLPAILASPPSAQTVGDGWLDMWKTRLGRLTFPLEAWVREEQFGTYWQQGTVIREIDTLDCPVLAIGGWSDRYSNSIMSLVEHRPDLVWGIVGPWGHHYPDLGHPGPAMDFQSVALDWWDQWLQEETTQTADRPRLRIWLRDFDPPGDALDRRSGQWIALSDPAREIAQSKAFYPLASVLHSAPDCDAGIATIPCDLRIGQAAGDTGYFGRFGGLPLDQEIDDKKSLVFATDLLTDDLILMGAAELHLSVRCRHPLSQISVRLNDVAPDGRVNRIVVALRNVALDDRLEKPRQTKIGDFAPVRIKLPTTAYRVRAGHRLRLSLSVSYWPIAWPSPQSGTIDIEEANSVLHVPLLKRVAGNMLVSEDTIPVSRGREAQSASSLVRSISEQEDGTMAVSWHQPYGSTEIVATGMTFGYETKAHHSLHPNDPASAVSRFDHYMRFERSDGTADVRSWAKIECTPSDYLLSGGVRVSWKGGEIFSRDWAPIVSRCLS